MCNTHLLKSSKHIKSVIFLIGFSVLLGGLSCYRQVVMPVIVEPNEDIPSGQLREQPDDETQDAQDLRCLPEDQTENPSESMKNAASNRGRESISAERGQLYQFNSESRLH